MKRDKLMKVALISLAIAVVVQGVAINRLSRKVEDIARADSASMVSSPTILWSATKESERSREEIQDQLRVEQDKRSAELDSLSNALSDKGII